MPERRLIKVGDRLINLDAITHAAFDPAATNPAAGNTWVELTVSFGCDDYTILYGPDAAQV